MSKAEIEFAAENAAKLGDLISRGALWTDIQMLPHNGDIIFSEEVEQAIKEAPAVDAEKVFEQMGLVQKALDMAHSDLVPVVRCRDCENWAGDPKKKPEYAGCWRYGAINSITVHENGFCDKGKRRTGL